MVNFGGGGENKTLGPGLQEDFPLGATLPSISLLAALCPLP